MRVRIDLERSLEENAADYFEKAKKARAKMEGARDALERTRAKLEKEQAAADRARADADKRPPEQHWYHKHRWSRTRNGHLLVGGQNADANEALVKKHGHEAAWILHTDMAGSPFVLLFADKEVADEDLEDAGTLVACYSRAWQKGMGGVEVLYVTPDQVTKEAQSGEYLPKGAFMIRGETRYVHPALEISIGVIEREGVLPEVFAGSKQACEKHCSSHSTIVPGKEKTSDVAKELRRRHGGDLDAYVKAIPAGGAQILHKA